MQKRGLSNIIATVLLVLLAIGAIALIWSFVGGIIGEGSTNTGLQAKCLTETDLIVKSCTVTGSNADVIIQLNKGNDVTMGTLVFEDNVGATTTEEVTTIPDPLETAAVNTIDISAIDTTGAITAVIRATVADEDGNTLICEATANPVNCATA